MNHAHAMRLCLEQAERYISSVAPNPMVGACLAVDNKVIACDAHQKFGGPHAEINVIDQINDSSLLKQATLYVSLEPCNHHGKTPPCTERIITSGIRSVVVACCDSNPMVSGKGIARLREHGISVVEGILQDEAQELNRRFFTYHRKSRPYIILKWAETADGYIARRDGSSKWISGVESRILVHQWRAQEQAILVGTRTALADNPALTVRDATGNNPMRIVIDRSGILPADLQLWSNDAKTLCLSEQDRPPHGSEEIISMNKERDVLQQLLATLYERNIISLIVEGGSDTINRFLDNNIWDEARIFTSQSEFGSGIKAPIFPSRFNGIKKISTSICGDDTLTVFRHF